MLIFHRTSIFTSNSQTVVNTVNTVGVMGKGLAKAYKDIHPAMFREYKKMCNEKKFQTGDLWLWKGSDQWVLNFPTKKHWRNASKIEYIEAGLKSFVEQYEDLGIREIAFPRLGCGNGGLDWSVVRDLMQKYLRNLPIKVYIHDFEKDIGMAEHIEGYLDTNFTGTYVDFIEDISKILHSNKGRLTALKSYDSFDVMLDEKNNLLRMDKDVGIIAAEEDLYRMWQVLNRSLLVRADLPEGAYENAFIIFSTLSSLPYIRPIQISTPKGVLSIALELKRKITQHNVADANSLRQEELNWA